MRHPSSDPAQRALRGLTIKTAFTANSCRSHGGSPALRPRHVRAGMAPSLGPGGAEMAPEEGEEERGERRDEDEEEEQRRKERRE